MNGKYIFLEPGTKMFFYLILLFIFIPILELYLLIKVAHFIGAFNTVMIVIGVGVVGAYLARLEGLRVFYNFQKELQEGRMPKDNLLDGLLILIGAILMIIPGLLTDILGIILIIPLSRALIKFLIKKRLQNIIDKRQGVITIEGYKEDEDKF